MIAKAYNKHVMEKSFQVGDVRVSAQVKLWVTCSGTARVATRVRHWVTRSGTTQVSNSGKVLGSDSGKESGTVSDKSPDKRLGKNSGKEARQDKTCKTGRFFCFGVNRS
jgi:hypothetical protein